MGKADENGPHYKGADEIEKESRYLEYRRSKVKPHEDSRDRELQDLRKKVECLDLEMMAMRFIIRHLQKKGNQ